MTTNAKLHGDKELLARIVGAREHLRAELKPAMETIGMRVTGLAKEKVSGSVLFPQTGTLRRKIHTVQDDIGTGTIMQRIGLSLVYARIHEFGGVIDHPGSDKFQAWRSSFETSEDISLRAGWVFTRGTQPHSIPIPERSFLRSSLRELYPWAKETIHGAIKRALGK